MTKKTYIFGTGKLTRKTAAAGPAPSKADQAVGGFAMPDATAMAAEAPEEPSENPDFSPNLIVVDDDAGRDPYDTQSLPMLQDEMAFPGYPAQKQKGEQHKLNDIQVFSKDLRVTDADEDNDPYNTTGRFEVRNIWSKVLKK